jgi:hypothetical protein
MLRRACGCEQEFQHYAVDKFRAQRQAKFQQTRCPACVARSQAEEREAAAALPKKGEALQMLPHGTRVEISRRPDGRWIGSLTAGGRTVEVEGDGLQAVTVALARQWAAAARPVPAPPKKAD